MLQLFRSCKRFTQSQMVFPLSLPVCHPASCVCFLSHVIFNLVSRGRAVTQSHISWKSVWIYCRCDSAISQPQFSVPLLLSQIFIYTHTHTHGCTHTRLSSCPVSQETAIQRLLPTHHVQGPTHSLIFLLVAASFMSHAVLLLTRQTYEELHIFWLSKLSPSHFNYHDTNQFCFS